MKKFKLLLLTVLCTVLFSNKVAASNKVKVYVFEAGGCPYCEAEYEYLEGLDSYNKKFEVEKKELYVDHVDWAKGKDYDLGVKVAEAFQAKGYENASYQGTPFVVIGNSYAEASYSESLEEVIEEAYENNSTDVVKCFMDNKDNCEDKIKEAGSSTSTSTEKKSDSSIGVLALTVIVCAGLVVLLIKLRNSNK